MMERLIPVIRRLPRTRASLAWSRALAQELTNQPQPDEAGQTGKTAQPDAGAYALPLDVYESDDAFTVYAELPGQDPSQVELTVDGDRLTIAGTKTLAAHGLHDQVSLAERKAGAFERSVVFSVHVDACAAKASFKQGLLSIHLPKSAASARRRIPVVGLKSNAAQPGEPHNSQ